MGTCVALVEGMMGKRPFSLPFISVQNNEVILATLVSEW